MAELPSDEPPPGNLTSPDGTAHPAGRLTLVALDRIERDPCVELRGELRKGSLEELRDSLARVGLLNPVHLVRKEDGFRIAQGHRRAEAARLLAWKQIPALVFPSMEEAELCERALEENVQREALSMPEIALTCHRMSRLAGASYVKIVDKIRRGKKTVQRLVRIEEKASPELLKAFDDGQVTYTQVLAILRVPEEQRLPLTMEVIERKLSLRETEGRADEILRRVRSGVSSEVAGVFGMLPEFVRISKDRAGGGFIAKLRIHDRTDLTCQLTQLLTHLQESRVSVFKPAHPPAGDPMLPRLRPRGRSGG